MKVVSSLAVALAVAAGISTVGVANSGAAQAATSEFTRRSGGAGFTAETYSYALAYKGPREVDGNVTITGQRTTPQDVVLATSTEAVDAVDVNGAPTHFHTQPGAPAGMSGNTSLIIDASVLPLAGALTVRVKYRFSPAADDAYQVDASGAGFYGTGALRQTDIGPVAANSNEKACMGYQVTVPTALIPVLAAPLVGRTVLDSERVRYEYRLDAPVDYASAQFAIGTYDIINTTPVNGTARQDVVPKTLPASDRQKLENVDSLVKRMANVAGPFPYPKVGVFIPDGKIAAFAAPTLLTIQQPPEPSGYVEGHELAHQWFGIAVSVPDSSRAHTIVKDEWLSEGQAHFFGLLLSTTTEEELAKAVKFFYNGHQQTQDTEGPPAAPRIPGGVNTREGGAIALYALRQQVGIDTFNTIETAFMNRYKHATTTTTDFLNIVQEIGGNTAYQTMLDFLYNPTIPPMPGHPDWKPNRS